MKILLGFTSLIFLFTSCGTQQTITAQNTDGSVTLFDNGASHVIIAPNGNVGIGQKNPQDKLEVNGQIHAKSVKVDLKEWADFVFEDGYDLTPLPELEQFIKTNGHLPDVPSAGEVAKDGIELGAMNRLLLQKIEELTLHLIQKEKDIDSLSANYYNLLKRVKVLETKTPKED
ncbi:hypothetical protein [Dokdonia sinensis]|nr:hypothetical protein [Dokdonia sinensis]